jgi:N-glycosylase/DNA lyase
MVSGEFGFPEPFSLGLTLLCGQCFRWQGPDPEGWFEGVAGEAYWRLRARDATLEWKCSHSRVMGRPADEWLFHYLGLDEDLQTWTSRNAHHPVLEKPIQVLKGLRLVRQEPWECAVSYMFAQGLSVKVIRHALSRFCGKFGRPIEGFPHQRAFPDPSALSGLTADEVRAYTNNYRARADRIIRFARVIEAGVISLEHLKTIPCDEARESLVTLDGIGPKIADCIMLFSLDQTAAYPVDRWVLRAMKRFYPSLKLSKKGQESPTRLQYNKIVVKARKIFGDHCGIASEYLFLFLRMMEDENLKDQLAPYCSTLSPLDANLSG